MSELPDLSVIIPAFQEAERLPRTLGAVASYLKLRDLRVEIVIVDDGSTDGTTRTARDITRDSGAESPVQYRVITLPSNRGKGAAVRAGVCSSLGARVLITDADLSTPIEELPKLESALLAADLAFGSRALRPELIAQRQPRYRETMGRVFNLLIRLLGVRGLRDTQCGFKLIDGEHARSLFRDMTIDGFAFDVELLLRARSRGLRVVEVPVIWNHVEHSRVKPVLHSLQMMRDVIRLRLGRL